MVRHIVRIFRPRAPGGNRSYIHILGTYLQLYSFESRNHVSQNEESSPKEEEKRMTMITMMTMMAMMAMMMRMRMRDVSFTVSFSSMIKESKRCEQASEEMGRYVCIHTVHIVPNREKEKEKEEEGAAQKKEKRKRKKEKERRQDGDGGRETKDNCVGFREIYLQVTITNI